MGRKAHRLCGFWRWHPDCICEVCRGGLMVLYHRPYRHRFFGTWKVSENGFEVDVIFKDCIYLTEEPFHISFHTDNLSSGYCLFKDTRYECHKLSTIYPLFEYGREYVTCNSFNNFEGENTHIIRVDQVFQWHEKCRPTNPYYLITTHSDFPITEKHMPIIDDELLITWYSTNVKINHPKLKPIPLGINHFTHHLGITLKEYDEGLEMASKMPKTKLFNMGFVKKNNFFERNKCEHYVGIPSAYIPVRDFFVDIGSSMFCISPNGNGIDCVRTWEALYTNTIPIITHNPMVELGLYDGLPVIILEDWSKFDKSILTEALYRDMIKEFDPSCLKVERWITHLNNKSNDTERLSTKSNSNRSIRRRK